MFVVLAYVFAFCLTLSESSSNFLYADLDEQSSEAEYIRSYVPIHLPKLTSHTGIGQLMALEFATKEGRLFRISLRPITGIVSSTTNVSTISLSQEKGTIRGGMNVVRTLLDQDRLFGFGSNLDRRQQYEGYLKDDPNSIVSGYADLKDGLFTGFVITDDEMYFLEPLYFYFRKKASPKSKSKHNTILYKGSDVYSCPPSIVSNSTTPWTRLNSSTGGIDCVRPVGLQRALNSLPITFPRDLRAITRPFGKFVSRIRDQSIKRMKRQVNDDKLSATTYLCDLRVVCDFRWHRYVASRNSTFGTDLVVSLLRRVDQMFRAIDLDGDGRPENLGLFLRYLDIYVDPVMPGHEDIEHWDAPRFFEEFGAYDFADVCAGLLLTYRQLSHDSQAAQNMPTLPRTNIAGLEQGICSQYVPPKNPVKDEQMKDPDYGYMVANALPVNFMISNRVASASSIIVQTAHQIGHLFGARDDRDAMDGLCRPDENDVSLNYIMAYPLVSAESERNFRWSPCSLSAIESFLRGLEQQERPCLKPCHDPVRCLRDRWSAGGSGDDDRPGLRQPRQTEQANGHSPAMEEGADNDTTTTITTTTTPIPTIMTAQVTEEEYTQEEYEGAEDEDGGKVEVTQTTTKTIDTTTLTKTTTMIAITNIVTEKDDGSKAISNRGEFLIIVIFVTVSCYSCS